ncbi:MAG: lactate dehydrogenase, partial [Anaerotignum sp.]|nr:lactate dehydrogenase [Anaerotignum sp.]
GPHGENLVIANSIEHYDDALSRELTRLAVEANLRTRELGFKPYVAPAISSAAISILLTLRGEWHYSSNFLGGVYMGCKNRTTEYGLEMEALPLPEALFSRIEKAYQSLEAIL